MADIRIGQTTGAEQSGYDLRRRNIPAQEGANGSTMKPSESEDTKKSQKVPHVTSHVYRYTDQTRLARNLIFTNTRRI